MIMNMGYLIVEGWVIGIDFQNYEVRIMYLLIKFSFLQIFLDFIVFVILSVIVYWCFYCCLCFYVLCMGQIIVDVEGIVLEDGCLMLVDVFNGIIFM